MTTLYITEKIKLLCQKTNNYRGTLFCINCESQISFRLTQCTQNHAALLCCPLNHWHGQIYGPPCMSYIYYCIFWVDISHCAATLPNSNHCTASTCNALKSFIYSNIPHQSSQILIRYNSDKNEYLHLMLLYNSFSNLICLTELKNFIGGEFIFFP